MNMQQAAALATIVEKLSKSPAISELKNSATFKEMEKQLDPLKDELLKSFTNIFSEKMAVKEDTVVTKQVADQYLTLVGRDFTHLKTGNIYSLYGITNLETTDENSFPITVVYICKQTGRIWSRPILEFYPRFKLI